MPSDSRNGVERPVVLLLLSVYLVEVLRNAWLADDAYITLRTIDNFVRGLGLTYNVGERVQAYTHPLWALLVSPFYAVTREGYFTVLALSVACSMAAVSVVVLRLSATRLHGVFVLVLLLSSKAFVDFSTSGLENPLTHLLLGLFAARYSKGVRDRRSLVLLALTAGLGMTNRMDTALLFLPGLALAAWGYRRWRGLGPLALGLAPFFVWEVFSLVYYGFPFPNTAYAKLGADIARSELIEQGSYYLVDSLDRDPLTLIMILSAMTVVVLGRSRSDLALAAGIGLYLTYVVAIGGDFMSGRFLSAAYYLAAVALSTVSISRKSVLAMVAVAVAVQLGALTPAAHDAKSGLATNTGIIDEKSFYFPHRGLPEVYRGARVRQEKPSGHSEEDVTEVWVTNVIGFRGYTRGPRCHVVDVLGLADPLLARLPTQYGFDWRIGHFGRKLPVGYLATLRSGTNQIEDPELARYYDRLSLVVRGELFSWARWRTIVAFQLGRYDRLIDRDFYRQLHSLEVPLRDLERVKFEGARWDARSNVVMAPRNGVLIRLPEVSHCSRLRLGLAGKGRYLLLYFRGGAPVPYYERGNDQVVRQTVPYVRPGGIRTRQVKVPPEVVEEGYDALLVYPLEANPGARHSVGHVRLCEDPGQASGGSSGARGSRPERRTPIVRARS